VERTDGSSTDVYLYKDGQKIRSNVELLKFLMERPFEALDFDLRKVNMEANTEMLSGTSEDPQGTLRASTARMARALRVLKSQITGGFVYPEIVLEVFRTKKEISNEPQLNVESVGMEEPLTQDINEEDESFSFSHTIEGLFDARKDMPWPQKDPQEDEAYLEWPAEGQDQDMPSSALPAGW